MPCRLPKVDRTFIDSGIRAAPMPVSAAAAAKLRPRRRWRLCWTGAARDGGRAEEQARLWSSIDMKGLPPSLQPRPDELLDVQG